MAITMSITGETMQDLFAALRNCAASFPGEIASATSATVTMKSTPVALPTAAAPKITTEQIMRAGVALMDSNPGTQPQLMALLPKYGVASLDALKADQIDAMAADLRALGAQI